MALSEYQLTTSVSYMPFTGIPTYLLDLLKLKTNDETRLRHQTLQLLQLHPDFKLILELLHGNESNIKMSEIVHRYHYEHFCEMIVASIINKKITGNYLKKINLTIALEIENLTKKFRPNGLSFNPRITILFIYLIFSAIDDFGADHPWIYAENLANSISSMQKYINTNLYESDWMILLLKLFEEALGKDNLTKHLQEKSSLKNIFAQLNGHTKNTIIKILINYSNSIEEEHLIFQDFI